jgi:sporulation protein YabP
MHMTDGQQLPHTLNLDERKKLSVTAVAEVVSFDEAEIVLRTSLGTLVVQGQELKLRQLTLEGGNVAVEGQIDSLVYEQTRQSGSVLRRFFG